MSTTEVKPDNANAPPLTLTLFGPFEVRVHGVLLPPLHSRKSLWLLALLALRNGKPVERDWLAGILWPDSGPSQGLAYLRQSLTELRRAFGSEAGRLQTPTRQTLALNLAGIEVDVLTFDACIEQEAEPTVLKRAVAAYRGSLLADCTEEWVLQERTDREHAYLMALQNLAEAALAQNETEAAVCYSRRAIGVDPLQEGAQRLLMQALVKEGNYAAATQVYRDLRLHLHRQLNAEPDPQTTALYDQLRAQTRQKAQTAPMSVPSLSSSPPPRHLPLPLTDLLGRDAEIGQIVARLRQCRLVTLTGTGGVGKTRLAITVAEALVEEYADGVWFVDLAALSDAGLVVQAIAAIFGVREEPGGSLQEALVSFLRPKLLLLVLDNCEHLLPACAQLTADLLQNCSGVRILATSRQPLGITGEVNWQVPSLPVPDLEHLPAESARLLAEVSGYASVQLFVERAEAARKTFDLTDQNALSVAFICARLDGIPLALELAASNVRGLSIEQIAGRLGDVFRLLTRGSSTALPRQQTLRATLDWSYDLLIEAERSLLQRLSVFSSGWTLEAAEQVCADTNANRLPTSSALIQEWDVLDVLTSLVDKSLVQVEEKEGYVRYRMQETVRQYARDRLAESGQSPLVRTRHSDCFLMLAEEVEPKLRSAEQAQWLRVLEQEIDNFRQAFDWYAEDAASDAQVDEKGLRMGAALRHFWRTRGYLSEGRERLRASLAHPGGQAPTTARAEALKVAGVLARMQGDYAAARLLQAESLTLYRELGDKKGIARSLNNSGNVAYEQGDFAAARPLYEECLAKERELGDKEGCAAPLHNLGNISHYQGDYGAARAFYEECLAIERALGDKSGMAGSLLNLGNVANGEGDYGAARSFYVESLALQRELGDNHSLVVNLESFAFLALNTKQEERCVRLWGTAAALRETLGFPLAAPAREMQEHQMAAIQETIGAKAFAVAWAQGGAMTMEQAVEYALEIGTP